mmetsp:Transcript_37118/g.62480  ORF Transcript_37118/g.62480 Transcript_37118/m.62480 type:complete len:261 (-) Transcript_37118:280-1062(-)
MAWLCARTALEAEAGVAWLRLQLVLKRFDSLEDLSPEHVPAVVCLVHHVEAPRHFPPADIFERGGLFIGIGLSRRSVLLPLPPCLLQPSPQQRILDHEFPIGRRELIAVVIIPGIGAVGERFLHSILELRDFMIPDTKALYAGVYFDRVLGEDQSRQQCRHHEGGQHDSERPLHSQPHEPECAPPLPSDLLIDDALSFVFDGCLPLNCRRLTLRDLNMTGFCVLHNSAQSSPRRGCAPRHRVISHLMFRLGRHCERFNGM